MGKSILKNAKGGKNANNVKVNRDDWFWFLCDTIRLENMIQ